MIVSISIVTGFQEEIREKVIGFGSHIQISHFDSNSSPETEPINKNQAFYTTFQSVEGIKHIQVIATKAGIIKTDNQMEGIILKGVSSDYDWSFIEDKIIEGNILQIKDSLRSKDIIISKLIAQRLKLKLGDSIRMYFIGKEQAQPKGRKLHIAGIYETGLAEYDKLFVLGDIAQIQSLNKWSPNQVGGFEVLINNFNDIEEISEYVYKNIPYDLDSKNIKQRDPQIFDWLQLMDMNVLIILILMIVVATINIISTFLILILERTSMIGLLKALGTRNYSIRKVFLYTSMYLVLKGLIWGNIIAISFCLIQKYFGFIKLPQESYYLTEVPIHFSLLNIVLLNLGTLLICFLILIIPSYIISKIIPVKAIRFS